MIEPVMQHYEKCIKEHNFKLTQTARNDVQKFLKKVNKATSLDQLSAISLSLKSFPYAWKIPNFKPHFKKRLKADLSNYIPIAFGARFLKCVWPFYEVAK